MEEWARIANARQEEIDVHSLKEADAAEARRSKVEG